MNATLRAIATDLADLAVQHNWPSLADMARAIAQDQRMGPNVLLALLDSDTSDLADWMESMAPQTALKIVLEKDTQTGLDLWLADKLVIAFPCGGLPTSNTLTALANGPLQRQPVSAAVVLIGAEEIETADDLALVESTARRWLLAPDAAGNPPQDVFTAGAFLWSRRTNSAFASRLTRDRDALARWLQTPLSAEAAEQLNRMRLLFAVSLMSTARTESSEGPAVDRRAIYRLQDDLADLKSRLLARLRSDSDQLERAAQQAVAELDLFLSEGLRAAVEQIPLARSRPEVAIRQSIGHYCDDRVRTWLARQQHLTDQWRRALFGLRELIEQYDWAALDTPLGQSDNRERLLALLEEQQSSEWMGRDSGVETRSMRDTELSQARSRGLRWSLGALGSGVLGAAAAALSGYGVLGMAVAGTATSTAAAGYQWHASRSDLRASTEAYGRQVIADLVATCRSQIPDWLANFADTLRQRLSAEFDAMQLRLDQHLDAPGKSTASNLADALGDIRNRLGDMVRKNAVCG